MSDRPISASEVLETHTAHNLKRRGGVQSKHQDDHHGLESHVIERIEFEVQQAPTEAQCTVTFIKDDENLTAACTCPAGQQGDYCVHRLDILRGNTAHIVSDNVDEAVSIGQWVVGTDVYSAMLEIEQWEYRAEQAESALNEARERLAESMRN